MADWGTISALATGGGTLVLAIATFGSVRSSNRTARLAERTLLLGIRPVLVPSRPDEDPHERLRFGDTEMISLSPGAALVRDHDENVYLALALRNVGAGLAVIHGWRPHAGRDGDPRAGRDLAMRRPDVAEFHDQLRDLYISANDTGFWQGALRDAADPVREAIRREIAREEAILTLDLLYGDHEGGQLTISRFTITPNPDRGEEWQCGVLRHWSVDGADPR